MRLHHRSPQELTTPLSLPDRYAEISIAPRARNTPDNTSGVSLLPASYGLPIRIYGLSVPAPKSAFARTVRARICSISSALITDLLLAMVKMIPVPLLSGLDFSPANHLPSLQITRATYSLEG